MQRKRVLTIEDDPAIRRGIVDALSYAGYEVLETGDGRQGAEWATQRPIDLLLLDLVLPGLSGWEILQQVRQVHPTMPVIILTARGDEADCVEGLRRGGDDYVVKPFSVKELLARVEAVLRRSSERPSDITEVPFAHGCVDLARREVRFADGSRTELSEMEAEFLRYLTRHRGRAVSREELLANVWRINPWGVSTRTIDMHVARLRDKMRDNPTAPEMVLTVRGKGYMLASWS